MLLIYIVILGISGHLAVNGQPYGPWSDWSECSVDEGQGIMRRTRKCIVNECPEHGEYLDFMACFVKPCKCEYPPEPGTEAPSKASTTSGIQIELSEEPSTVVSTGSIEIGVSEEPTTFATKAPSEAAENATTQSAQKVSTGTISIGLVEETTTVAPQKTATAPSEETTAVPPASEKTTAAPGEETTAVPPATQESTAAPGEETTVVPPASEESTAAPGEETTAVPPATKESTAAPGEETAVPPVTEESTAAPSKETTAVPPATEESTAGPGEETTAVPPATNETTTAPSEQTAAVSPATQESTVAAAGETTAVTPVTEETTGAAQIKETTAVPPATKESTAAPSEKSTAAQPATNESTAAPSEKTTAAPLGTQENTAAPGKETTAVPPATEEGTAAPGEETTVVPLAMIENTAAPSEETTAAPPEIPCEDNPLGAAEGGKLPSSSFTAPSSFGEFVPSAGRLNGPLAWCSHGDVAGQEFLEIHVPEAEAICAVAIQGTGYERGEEHVKEYYLEYSKDGFNWQVVEEDGYLKMFKGNDDSKSTSKQELPVPLEAKYIRIYPVEYAGWMCLRAELYGKERTQAAPFPTVPEKEIPNEETTAISPGESTAAPGEETTAVPSATEETTAAPNEETTAVPPGESTAAPGEQTTAVPPEESTAAPSKETTAVPPATEESTAAPGEETTAVPPEIPCEDNPLGAAQGGKLPSSSFEGSPKFGIFVPSAGRLNGPLAWCSQGVVAGKEFLQIHVPEAEEICAVATQGTGFGSGNEHVKEYYLEYSKDGINWQVVQQDGNVKIFKGNDDAKSTSKQELPVPIEAKYIRIYPVEYAGWMCLRAELYGKEKTQAPFPTGTEETTGAAQIKETTAVPPATEESTSAQNEETTAIALVTGETTASPNEETTAVPPGESTAAPSKETTAVPPAPEESTAAPGEETTAVPPGPEETTTTATEEKPTAPPAPPCIPVGASFGGPLPDSSFSASSDTGDNYAASNGRLNGPKAWCAKNESLDYLEIQLPTEMEICAIATQGLREIRNKKVWYGLVWFDLDSWVKSYDVLISKNGDVWSKFTLEGNINPETVSKQRLPIPIVGRFIRIYPLDSVEKPCMRVEIYATGEATAAPSEETTAVPPATEGELPTTGQEALTPSARVIPPAPITEVKRKGLDIGILIDSSFGLSPDEFEQLKQFISQLVFSINVHFTDVHFGIIVYSDVPALVMTLQNVDRLDVVSVIDGVKYIPGGHRTDRAMLYASRKLFCPEKCKDRPEEENVMIVFSSENADAESLPYRFVTPIMKNCTSNIIAVGISNEITTSELIKIALGTPDRVLRVASTFDLEEETITKIEDMIEEGPIVSTTQGASA